MNTNKNTKRYLVLLDSDDLFLFDKRAKKQGKSRSEKLRELIKR